MGPVFIACNGLRCSIYAKKYTCIQVYCHITVHHRNPNTKKQMILLTHLYAVVAPTTIVGLPGERIEMVRKEFDDLN